MPNSTRPSGPGKPHREATDRVRERENLDEAMSDNPSDLAGAPHAARTAPKRTPPPMRDDADKTPR
jgi:hypothetical protein|nr:hypothetical protein [uncultured Caldimonas sp.]